MALLAVSGLVAGAAGFTPDRVSEPLWVLGATLLLPVGLALYPDGRTPRGLGVLGLVPIVATAGLALAYPADYARTGVTLCAQILLLIGLLWWRHAHAGPDERRAVLWGGLGLGTGTLVVLTVSFGLSPWPAAVVAVVATTGAMTMVAVGLVAPDRVDVRSATVTVVVHLVGVFVALTCYCVVLAAAEVASGAPLRNPGTLGIVAAVVALGYHPVVTVLRGVVDRLVFGDRRTPLEAVSRVGQRLGDDPVHALRALRESLALPYAALVDGTGAPLAVSGAPTTTLVEQELRPGDPTRGRLVVGLRVGEAVLPVRDREVLGMVAASLGQLVEARRLSAELAASRSAVVQAVEEERRRLRRDLHDGLGPRLTGVAYTADAARNVLDADPSRAADLMAGLRAEAGEAIAEVRRLVEGLRPPSLDQVGLVESLRQHATGLLARDGAPLAVRLTCEDLPPLGAALEVATYRIVVEALTNAARHSGGHRCEVRLAVDDGVLVVEVADDGAPGRAWRPGVGLGSMRERAEMLGGTLRADGGRVTALLPV